MRKSRWPLLALVMTLLACWSAWTLWVLSDEGRRDLAPKRIYSVKAPEWRLIHGEGEFVSEGLQIVRPGRRAEVLIALDLPHPINSDLFEYVDIYTSGAAPALMDLQWSVTDHFSLSGQALVQWLSPGHGRVQLNNARGWEGQPLQLALRSVGFSGPWTLHSLEISGEIPDFSSLQRGFWQRLTRHEDWHFRNINYQAPPALGLRVSFTAMLAAWLAAATAVLLYLRFHGLVSATWLAVPLCVAWFALDMRWQAELLHKMQRSVQSYASLPLAERGQAEIDASLFALTEALKDRHARHEFNRIFAVSDPYWSTRARYRLANWGARSLPEERLMDFASVAFEVGDLILVREDLNFDVVPVSATDESGLPSRSPRKMRVQSLDGQTLIEGVAILNVESHWAILIMAKPDQALD